MSECKIFEYDGSFSCREHGNIRRAWGAITDADPCMTNMQNRISDLENASVEAGAADNMALILLREAAKDELAKACVALAACQRERDQAKVDNGRLRAELAALTERLEADDRENRDLRERNAANLAVGRENESLRTELQGLRGLQAAHSFRGPRPESVTTVPSCPENGLNSFGQAPERTEK